MSGGKEEAGPVTKRASIRPVAGNDDVTKNRKSRLAGLLGEASEAVKFLPAVQPLVEAIQLVREEATAETEERIKGLQALVDGANAVSRRVNDSSARIAANVDIISGAKADIDKKVAAFESQASEASRAAKDVDTAVKGLSIQHEGKTVTGVKALEAAVEIANGVETKIETTVDEKLKHEVRASVPSLLNPEDNETLHGNGLLQRMALLLQGLVEKPKAEVAEEAAKPAEVAGKSTDFEQNTNQALRMLFAIMGKNGDKLEMLTEEEVTQIDLEIAEESNAKGATEFEKKVNRALSMLFAIVNKNSDKLKMLTPEEMKDIEKDVSREGESNGS